MTWTNNYQPQAQGEPQQGTPIPSLGKLINGGGGKAFFNAESQPGATITGTISKVEARQKLDYQTKQPMVSKKGNPKYEMVVTITTSLREDPDDDGNRNIYINLWGTQLDAIRDACRKAHVEEPKEGDRFTATFTGMGQPFAPGMSAPKLYEYRIEKPANPVIAQALNMPTGTSAPQALQTPQGGYVQAQTPHVDAMQVTSLRNMGKSDQEIAQLLGVPLNAVTRIAGQARVQGSEMNDEPEF